MKRRIFAFLLSVAMMVSLIVPAAAETEPTEQAVYCTYCGAELSAGMDHAESCKLCKICGAENCEAEHVYCETCSAYDCGKTHVFCETCQVMDCGVDHSTPEVCEVCNAENCTATHVWCETCQIYDCGVDHTPVESEEKTCTCGTETHDAACPLYVAPAQPDAEGEVETEQDNQCTCTPAEDGTHSTECPLYVAPVVTPETEEECPELEEEIIDNYNGVTVKINAPEGAFPEGTKVSVDRVESEDTLAAITDALAEKEAEYTFGPLAYDITFTYEDEEIQPADGYEVEVSFDVGDHVSGTITDLNVYHMAEVVEEEAAAATFSTFSLLRTASTEETEETVTYEAELVGSNTDSEQIEVSVNSFSIYVVTGGTGENHYNYEIFMSVGDTLELTSTNTSYDGQWSLASGDIAAFSLSSTPGTTTEITAHDAGTVTVQYRNETITVTSVPAAGSSYQNDIIFKNIQLNIDTNNDAYTNTYGPYVMKIRFEDTEGNLLDMGEDYYVFDSECNIDINTFATSAPDGMTYAGAFFYWTSHNDFDGAKVYVTSVSREDSLAYGSYLWYSGTHDSSGQGSWAYQASGVLHVVYAPIDEVRTIIFKDHCGYELANYALSYNDRGVTFPTGYVDNIDNMANALIPSHHDAHDAGYEFEGTWVVTGGGNGINGTYTTSQLKSNITIWNITSNITITAVCEEPATITYVPVTGTALNDTTGGTVTPGSETVSRDATVAAGSVASPNADYEFKGWYSDAALTNQVFPNLNYVPSKPADGWVDDTYYAVFVEKEVTINYVAKTFSNGVVTNVVGGNVNPTSETIAIITGNAQGSTPTAVTGYQFIGWFEDEGCTDAVDEADGTVGADSKFVPAKVNDKNVADTYYAKFEEIEDTITYVALPLDGVDVGTVNLNGDSDEATTIDSETFGIVTGDPVGAIAAPISTTYKFVGWYDNGACSGNPVDTDASFDPANAPTGDHSVTTYYAKFDYNLTTMKVTKTVNGTPYDSDDTFIFQVKDSTGKVIANFTLKNGGSVTIKDVTVGEKYYVEEIQASNRYTVANNESTLNITIQANTDETQKNVVAFTNNIGETKWLTATSVEKNVFGN